LWAPHPLGEGREQSQGLLAIADEIVVDHEDRTAKARGQNGVELAAELRWLLGARLPAEELDDVAELATERAAATPLHADGVVGLDVEQVVAGRGNLFEVGALRAHESSGQGGAVAEQSLAQGSNQILGLADHDGIHVRGNGVGRGRCVRTTRDNGFAHGPGPCRHFQHGRPLHQHAGQENDIGPCQILVLQRPHVHVAKADFPVPRKHGRHREQAERRQDRALADELERSLVSPVGLGKHGRDTQNLHARINPRPLSALCHGRVISSLSLRA
jgi:hypothetical protein